MVLMMTTSLTRQTLAVSCYSKIKAAYVQAGGYDTMSSRNHKKLT